MKLLRIKHHKIKLLVLFVFIAILLLNFNKFFNSFISLGYTIWLLFSDFNLGSKYFYTDLIEYWVGSLYILITLITVLVMLFKAVFNEKKTKDRMFSYYILEKVFTSYTIKICFVFIYILISIGFLCPFISTGNPYEISNISVSRYKAPLNSIKYLTSPNFSLSDPEVQEPNNSDEELAMKIKEIKDIIILQSEKIYFDSLGFSNSKLLLHQGRTTREASVGEIGFFNENIRAKFFILGTDGYGRDLFSRILYGTRVSMSIAIISLILSLIIGVTIGLISGYFGGFIDGILMRFVDVVLAFPTIFLIFMIVGFFGNSIFLMMFFLGITTWMDAARLVRGHVLSIKNENYILSAKSLGYSNYRILVHHILPNILTPVLINASFRIANIILAESALSFIGIGVRPPVASWGNIINEGKDTLTNAWWISLFPGLLITLTVISFNLIGDKLREVIKK